MMTLPDRMARDIYELEPEYFLQQGVRLLVLDVDNTISPYHIHEASPELLAWAARMRAAGLELYILSNNRGNRPALFAAALGCPYIGRAKKPRTEGLREILRRCGLRPEQAAVIGDQIRSDIRCAQRCGCRSVMVRPICIRNPFLALRYLCEAPWRAAYRRKHPQATEAC